MDLHNDEISTASLTFLSLFTFLECIIGIILHFKIIKASMNEKEVTWKLDVTNSSVLMAHYFNMVFTYILYNNVDNFYTFTGEWFCYLSKVAIYYGILYITAHSLVVSIMKYFIIVRWQEVSCFGRQNAINIFFWINLLHPILTILLHLIIRPDFFWAFDGFAQIDRCLGEENQELIKNDTRHKVLTFDFCDDFIESEYDGLVMYLVNILRTAMCGLHIIFLYLVVWNLLEIVFYCLIFQFLRR